MTVQRILVDTPATLTASFYDAETLVDPGTVTVTITRGDGTAIVTDAATVGAGAAPRTYELAAQTALNLLQAVWTGDNGRKVTTWHEIVGGFYAELSEIRALDTVSNDVKYPTAKLEVARTQAEDRFEEATGVAWVRRYARTTLSGDNTTQLLLPHPLPRSVTAVSIDGTAAADLTLFRLYATGIIERAAGIRWPKESGGGGGNVVVEYTHGYDRPPEDIRQAFLTYVRYLLLDLNSRIPDRASVMSTDLGTFQLTTAGFKRPTGLPDVDAVLNDHDHSVPGLAAV